MSDVSQVPTASAERVRFGTFAGVFTPNVLTILGVIMFLRFGQIVGQSGIMDAIMIVLCAKLITSLTAVSLAGVATNTRVKGGGAYFLISRSLGPEFGGAIGVVFFLAQAISVAMYVIGFTEAFTNAFPGVGTVSHTRGDHHQRRGVHLRLHWCRLDDQGAVRNSRGAWPVVGVVLHRRSIALFAADSDCQPASGLHTGREYVHDVRAVFPGGDRNHGRRKHVRRSEGAGQVVTARYVCGDRGDGFDLSVDGPTARRRGAAWRTDREQFHHERRRVGLRADRAGCIRGNVVFRAR